MKAIKELVQTILKDRPETRDNDELLIALIWGRYLKAFNKDPDKLTARDFLRLYAYESILPSAESIRRSRQKLQEEDAFYRGRSYNERQAKAERVKEELRG